MVLCCWPPKLDCKRSSRCRSGPFGYLHVSFLKTHACFTTHTKLGHYIVQQLKPLLFKHRNSQLLSVLTKYALSDLELTVLCVSGSSVVSLVGIGGSVC